MVEINIQRPFDAFSQHISDIANQRILFSAPFGSGKTYFLKSYFETISQNANAFWLSPVKYVVSPNEDVFEYIKYDLAFQLLQYESIKQELKDKIGETQFVYQYIVNNPKDIFKLLFSALENAPIELIGSPEPITKAINKTGKFGNTIIDAFTKYQEFKSKLNVHLEKSEKILNDYLNDSKDIKGSIYEDDFISQMIRLALKKVKSEEKDNVLIIDDLDRLDPEHIFRILNILSVHQDFKDGQNKFGFDKIIVVCDIENIKKIYEHKYGKEVDFDGYIEKFYSTSIFSFSNQQAIAFYCQSSLSVELTKEALVLLGEYLTCFVNLTDLTIRSVIKHQIKPIIGKKELVRDILINEKNIDKFIDLGYTNGSKFIGLDQIEGYGSDEFYINSTDFEYLEIIKILIVIFGNLENLLVAVDTSMKKGKYITVTNKRTQALKIIAPFQHLMENINKTLFLAISLHPNSTYPSQGNNIISYPYIRLFNINVKLDLKWSKNNMYKGDESFYKYSKEAVNEEQIKADAKNLTTEGNKLNMDELLSALKGAIEFLKNRDCLDLLS